MMKNTVEELKELLKEKPAKDIDFSQFDLVRADLKFAELIGSDFEKMNLDFSDLSDAELCDANLRGANLCNADLCNANFCEANLQGANFEHTIIDRKNFEYLKKNHNVKEELFIIKEKCCVNKEFSIIKEEYLKMDFRNNKDKTEFSRLDFDFIKEMAEHLTKCSQKYPDIDGKPNWQKTPSDLKKDVLDSAMRHLVSLYNDELLDEETGTHHAVSSAVNLMFYFFHKSK